ncbi:TnsD family Tn7-like transposition protein [Paenibacillus mesotrionivorans]|uniref:TnsD family Tn7-like transposition protein n=1 Tax=Paenibacillus mesotrionivorans TaxID=3160968 RepID=A0ACC7NU60_9BACL
MLAFFPRIYEDEDLRSIIFRYHKMSGNRRFAHSLTELFGSKSHTNVPVPENITYLQNQLTDNVDNLIEKHTLHNYIAPFSANNIYSARHAMFTGKKLLSEKIRYCAVCIESDFNSFGECYIHKTHQIEFLTLCPKHSEVLITKCPECNAYLTSPAGDILLNAPYCPNGHVIKKTIGQCISQLEEIMYQEFEDFKHYSTGLTRPIFLSRIENWLGEKGYYSFTGSVLFRRKLIKDIIDQFGESELDKLGLTSAYLYSSSTLQNMINSKSKGSVNVIFFLLLMKFLAGSVQNFFETQPTYTLPIPFGNGPWKCINKICPYYNTKIISQCVRSNDRGFRIICEFRCSFCASSYKKFWHWPERDEQDERPMVLKSKEFYETILMLNKQGSTISSIAKQLKTSYVTVKKTLTRYGVLIRGIELKEESAQLEEINASFAQVSCSRETIDRRMLYRSKFKDLLLGVDELKRSKLRKKDATTYDWLLKNDRTWIENLLPVSKKHTEKVNWEKEEREICRRIDEVARQVYKSPPPDRRITSAMILKNLPIIDRNRIRKVPYKLPIAKSKLKQYFEDPEKFQIRFLPVALKRLSNAGLPLNLRSLRKRFPTVYINMSLRQQELVSDLVLDCTMHMKST